MTRKANTLMTVATGALAGFGVTLVACPLILHTIRHRILDEPNHRSSHDQPTPRGGGLAIFIGALVAMAVTPGLSIWRLPLALAATGFGLLGLLDDLRTLRARTRLVSQGLVAAITLPLLLRDLSGPVPWKILFGFGVLLWLVSCVNAINFMDGINGISAAQAVVAGIAWAAIGGDQHVAALAAGGLIIAACAVAFAPFNYPRARMFLGDVGSYFLGGWFAVLVVAGLRSGLPIEAVVAPLALGLVDTLSTILRRARRRESLQQAHRDHVYQRLVLAGWSHTLTTGFVALIATACSAVGAATIALRGSPARWAADAVLVAIVAAYLYSPALVAGSPARRPAPAQ